MFASKLGFFGCEFNKFMKFLSVIFAWDFAFKCPYEILIFRLDISIRNDGLFTVSKELIESLLVSDYHEYRALEVPEVVEALAAG